MYRAPLQRRPGQNARMREQLPEGTRKAAFDTDHLPHSLGEYPSEREIAIHGVAQAGHPLFEVELLDILSS